MSIRSDLFDLIRSLSKTEKAYFKKNSSVFLREGGNKYLQLFDAIEKQETYNEQQILQQFKTEKFIRQLPVAKNYLYNRILDTLQDYHRSALSEVHGLMDKAEYLFEKGLYSQSDKLLRMAEKAAQKHELHSILITIYEHQKFNQSLKKREPKIAEKNIDRSEQEVLLLNNQMAYQKLLARTQHVYNLYGKTSDKKYLLAFQKIMRSPLLKDESRALTFSGKRRFYDIHAVYNSSISRDGRAYHFSQKIISLFDASPEKKKQAPIQYAGYINNTLLYCHFLKKYPEIEGHLKKLNEIKHALHSKYEQARFFEIYSNNLMNLYNSTGRFEQVRKILPALISEMNEHGKRLADRDKLLLYGNIANTFFGLEEYKNCLGWINKIRNELPAGIRPDFDSEMQLLNIIVHYELNHADLIPHLVTSYYRFLSKKEMITRPERYLLAYFRKLAGADTSARRIHYMTVLRDQIVDHLKQKGKRAYDTPFFFDIVSWLESKIEKKSFAEVIRKKTEKHWN